MDNKYILLEHKDIPKNIIERVCLYFYLFFLYIGIPTIIFYLIKWDPVVDYNEDGLNKPLIIILVLVWIPFLYNFRKNRLLVKSLKK